MRNKKLFVLVGIIILISTCMQTDVKIDNTNEEMQIDDDNNNNELRTAVLWTVDDDGPADFVMIQEAINAASPGDTIIVRDGIYTENIEVNKSNLIIKSENGALKTIIQAATLNYHIIEVTAEGFNISGFTIKGSGNNYAGILISDNLLYQSISYLNFSNNYYGIKFYSNRYSPRTLSKCQFLDNYIGVKCHSDFNERYGYVELDHCNFSKNDYGAYSEYWCGVHANFCNFSYNSYGIYGYQKLSLGSDFSIFTHNTYAIHGKNTWGIGVYNSNFTSNHIGCSGIGMTGLESKDCIFQENTFGISLQQMYDDGDPESVIVRNTNFTENGWGLYINNYAGVENEVINCSFSKNCNVSIDIASSSPSHTQIYLNNFIDNNIDVDTHSSGPYVFNTPNPKFYEYNGKQFENYLGNYWSDYFGVDEFNGPNQDLPGSDGIGDTPYIIDSSNQDQYPLMMHFEEYFQKKVNTSPDQPYSIFQFKSDTLTEIPEGGTSDESTIVFKGTISDPDLDQVRLEIELREIDQPFTGEPTPETISVFVASGTEATTTRYGLDPGEYHWQYRTKDSNGAISEWKEFGTPGNTDFIVSPEILPKFLTLPFRDPDIKIQQGWRYDAPIGPDPIDPYAHNGIDYIKGNLDNPPWQIFDVIAAADGVAMQSSGGGYGTFVLIRHEEKDNNGKNYFTLYAHLDNVANGIVFKSRWDIEYSSWTPVNRGDFIGKTGSTGVEGHPDWIHLHFEVLKGGYAQNKIDPYDLNQTREFYPGGSSYIGCGTNYLWTTDPPNYLFLIIDDFLMDRDPFTRYLFKESTDYFISTYGESIWAELETKISVEFEIDLANNNEILLLGFAPKIKLKIEAWKEGDDIYIKVIPKFKVNMGTDDITFSGPFNLLQRIKSTVASYPGVDLGLEFGIGGSLEIKWDTITDSFNFEQWDVGIWTELKLKGQYITLIASLVNPVVAKALEELDHIIDKVTDHSFLNLLTGDLKLKLAFSVGSDSDGFYAKLDLKPEANLINVDLDLDKDPEVIAGVYSAFSLKWNKNGIGTDGEIKACIKFNLDLEISIPFGKTTISLNGEKCMTLFSFDKTLWDTGGGGGASSLRFSLTSDTTDTDLDGLIDYYENILGTSVNDPDTDNDKISDYFEVLYGTNPLDNDTDNDGLSDFDEIIIYYTNPLEEDTDFDDITDFDEIQGTYDGVITSPILNDTDLDGLLDGKESKAVDPANPGTNASDYDTDGDGYSDGNEINKYSTDPLDDTDIPIDTDSDGISDIDENEIGSDPYVDDFSQDSDSDGIPDKIEELVFKTNKMLLDSDSDGYNDTIEIVSGTNPNNPLDYPGANYQEPDTDGDGLPDVIEIHLYGTNIALNDTDGDSYDDLEEILMGSDPNDPSSIPEFDYHSNFDDIEDLLDKDGVGGGGIVSGGDDDDDEESFQIPFGNYYLLFAAISIISLIVIKKRKAIFSKN